MDINTPVSRQVDVNLGRPGLPNEHAQLEWDTQQRTFMLN